jgi:diaminohydroxyphosphoribosylaminopyrimidine deaminase/5-amino-6-(5-phosphoribosylamino)uracil reductase
MRGAVATTVKLATSLDGRIATASGESRWITSEAARREVHRLRAAHDAVLIGSETAVLDDPELSVRLGEAAGAQPLRVVFDTRLRIAPNARLFQTLALGPVVIMGARGADPAARAALERAGALVELAPRALEGVDLRAALNILENRHGMRSLFVEGGGKIAASFAKAGLIDRLEWFRAPILLGAEARPGLGPLGLEKLADAPTFERVAVRELGPDLWETYERRS